MFPANYIYQTARSFDEAIRLSMAAGPDSKFIAGGQTLIPMMKLRLLKPSHLIDIGRIPGAAEIAMTDDVLSIGALATHASMANSEAAKRFPIIYDCAAGIADVQIRSMGTIGGSLAEADPCSCWPTLLMALDASVKCVGPDGAREQTVLELLKDAYTPSLREYELMTHIMIKRSALDGQGAFVAFKRAAPAYPSASCALMLKVSDGLVEKISLALGCVGMTPIRVHEAPELVVGETLDDELIENLARFAAEYCEPVADNKGSVAYKRSLVKGLVTRAFQIAEQRRLNQPVEATHSYYG